MAKKKVKSVKKVEPKETKSPALLADVLLRIKEQDNSIKGLIKQINLANTRIDKLLDALKKSKTLKGI